MPSNWTKTHNGGPEEPVRDKTDQFAVLNHCNYLADRKYAMTLAFEGNAHRLSSDPAPVCCRCEPCGGVPGEPRSSFDAAR
jgi:hypothetical protein